MNASDRQAVIKNLRAHIAVAKELLTVSKTLSVALAKSHVLPGGGTTMGLVMATSTAAAFVSSACSALQACLVPLEAALIAADSMTDKDIIIH